MYQFTEQEFAVLDAAQKGTLVVGSAEYQVALAAVSRVVDYNVPFRSTIEAEVDAAARALINNILAENSNKPNAAFYTKPTLAAAQKLVTLGSLRTLAAFTHPYDILRRQRLVVAVEGYGGSEDPSCKHQTYRPFARFGPLGTKDVSSVKSSR